MIINIDDFHAKESGAFSWLTEKKLTNLSNVFEEWRDKASRFLIKGDFFHTPNPSHNLVARCAKAFKPLGSRVVDTVFMPGNHDPLGKNSSPFAAFIEGTKFNGRGMTLVTADQSFYDEEVKSVYCAWSKAVLPKAPSSDWQFFGHVQVNDWIKFSKEGHSINELESLGYKRMYLGDFHPFKDDGKVVSVGTFGASDFSDEGLKSGYVISNDDGSFVRVIFDYPVFHTYQMNVGDSIEPLVRARNPKGNIVRVKLAGRNQDLTNDAVAEVTAAFSAYSPLWLQVDKVYEQEAQPAKKELVSLSEIKSRHIQGWPELAKQEYRTLNN